MKNFFSAKSLHLDERCLLSSAPKANLLATYGVDNFILTLDPQTSTETRYEMEETGIYPAMTLAPDGSHCLFGTSFLNSAENAGLVKFDFASKQKTQLAEHVSNGTITALQYGQSGNFVAVGTQDGKTVILQPRTGRKQKCRPGHMQPTVSVILSADEQFLGSIGQDQVALIYRLSAVEQPQEVARYNISKQSDCSQLVGSFHAFKHQMFLPGERYLQKLELLDNRWEMIKLELISHGENVILLTQCVKENTIFTSSKKQVCVWNIRTQQKLFEIEEFNLTTSITLAGTVFGMRDDGQLYRYKRDIKEEEPMDIEDDRQSDRIDFDEVQSEMKSDDDQSEKKSEVEFYNNKKTKADKIITCLPQPGLTSATNSFEGQRFLFVNQFGCVVQRLQASEETTIQVEFGLGMERVRKVIIAHNRVIEHFDINPFALVYATEKEFGVKVQPGVEGVNWEVKWNGIRAVSIGAGWLAVANEEEIKLLDLCGHEIRTISFDRQIVALRAHENLLAVVYHESVPMWGAQQLAMQLILVDSSLRSSNMIATVPVPVRPGTLLRSINFSTEGMLVSQDTAGTFRVFSLERGDWTSVSIDGLEDVRKAWIIGVSNHELIFWRTSSEDPEPTVSPRFNIENTNFFIPTIGVYPENTQDMYEKLLWSRFALDHEKARTRLWGKLKVSRPEASVFSPFMVNLMGEKEIAIRHEELDQKFYHLIQVYLKADEPLRAFFLGKTCLRSLESVKKLTELFDFYKRRNLAIQMEEYCELKQREKDYEKMQIFEFIKMREAAEQAIKPKTNDIMRRPPKKSIGVIPTFSQSLNMESDHGSQKLSQSQLSQNSESIAPSQPEATDENPFRKRKTTNQAFEAKKSEIAEHVEKYGIKKKIDDRSGNRKTKA